MSTYRELKQLVINEIKRPEAAVKVVDAIQGAISHYENEVWWWQEGRATSQTANGQAFYAVPSDLISFDSLLVTLTSSKVPLDRVTYTEIDELDSGLTLGRPDRWAYYSDQIRLYPVPDDAYVLTLSYQKREADLSTESSENAWTTTAQYLVAYHAAADILESLGDPRAQMLRMRAERERGKLMIRRDHQMTGRRLAKSEW